MFCALLAAATTFAHADTVIPTDPSAATSNFGTPGATANAGYTIAISDANGYMTIHLDGTSDAGVVGPFANLYFDTTASTAGSGSNLGFQFGPPGTTNNAFIPGGSTFYPLTAGFSETFTGTSDGYDATIVIPNAFFETDPDSMGFTTAADGSLVSLHLSQTFSYSVVGGSGNFAAPAELGAVTLADTAATPEPSSITLLGTGLIAAAGMVRRRFKA